ncbi:MAG: M20/M25/M40 family metallo-hydrolase [Lysobacter sp.]
MSYLGSSRRNYCAIGSQRLILTLALLVAMPAALAAGPSLSAVPGPTDADRVQARELIEQLIRIQTVKGNGQVPVLAELLSQRFRAAGFAADDIQIVPVDSDVDTTAALIVRYRGRVGSTLRPVAILGHMDVVGAVASNWSVDPFVPVEQDGYLYGRGSIDNKAQVALIASTFIRLKRAGWVPERDLVLALSGDEESGSRTTQLLTRHPWIRTAEFALNADSGSGDMDSDGSNKAFYIQAAEKTSVSYKVDTRNNGGHSSVPRQDNALYDMAVAIQRLQALRFPVQFNEINRAMVAELIAKRGGELGKAFQTLLDKPDDAAARAVVEQSPEDAHVLWTTCVPTMIEGGNARNALPQNASLTVHCRIFPGVSPDSVRGILAAAVAPANAEVSIDAARGSSPASAIHPTLFAAVRKAVDSNYPDATLTPQMSSGGTDGRYFRIAGIPTYGVGSLVQVHPDDDRAHGIDERVRLDSFARELDFWDALLRDIAGPQSQP